jgi:putative addiction module component (TIGR02574 family)
MNMSETDIAEILKLSVEERLRLVELIWDSIAANPAAVPLGDVQRQVIDERLAEHNAGPDDVISREQVLAEAQRG